MNKSKLKNYMMNLTPLFGLAALFAAFLILGTIRDINISYGLKSIITAIYKIILIRNK